MNYNFKITYMSKRIFQILKGKKKAARFGAAS